MPEVICDTSPLQYLHQIDLLHILPALAGRVVIPPAVERELSVGRKLGVNLPDLSTLGWIEIQSPRSKSALPLINDLGPGETEVLMLALETPDSIAILDDALARRMADALKVRFTGTLRLLVSAKQTHLVTEVRPFLDQLQNLNFRMDRRTRESILNLAGEAQALA